MSLYEGLDVALDEPAKKQAKKSSGAEWQSSRSMFAAQLMQQKALQARQLKRKPIRPSTVPRSALVKGKQSPSNASALDPSHASSSAADENSGKERARATSRTSSSNSSHSISVSRQSPQLSSRISTKSPSTNSTSSTPVPATTATAPGHEPALLSVRSNSLSEPQSKKNYEPFVDDPLVYKEIEKPYNPWKPNEFDLVKIRHREQEEEREEKKRRAKTATFAPPTNL